MTDALEIILEVTEPDTPHRAAMLKKAGYLTREEITVEVNQRLQDMDPLQIAFTIQQCTKCGNRGDPRFVHEKCHVTKESYHPKGLEKRHKDTSPTAVHPSSALPYHPGALAMKHPGKMDEQFHPDEKGKIHVKELKKCHTKDKKNHHPSEWPIKCHPDKPE